MRKDERAKKRADYEARSLAKKSARTGIPAAQLKKPKHKKLKAK